MRIQDVESELNNIIDEFNQSSFEVRQAAIQAGAEVMVSALEKAAPRQSGELANSFMIKTQYPNHRYVGSTRTVDGRGKDGRYRKNIPLINILEYDEIHPPLLRTTYADNEQRIYDAIKNKLQEELKKI